MPEKQAIMLIIKNNKQEVFMQKRPPVGIWGSLWCFPQFENMTSAEDWLDNYFGLTLVSGNQLTKLKHTFSHFHLHIQPLIISVKTPINLGVMESNESFWYNITTEFNGGLAAPVQTLLNQLKE